VYFDEIIYAKLIQNWLERMHFCKVASSGLYKTDQEKPTTESLKKMAKKEKTFVGP